MSDRKKGISLLIPCYNEADGIADVLDHARAVLEEMNVRFEIIVIDDGSTDGSAQAIDTEKARVISNPENMGYGASLKIGARAAHYDLIAIADADGTYPIEELKTLYAAIDNMDMVVGARTRDDVKIPLIRKPAKWVLNKLANYLSGQKIPDLNSGLRLARWSLWKKYERFFPNGFSLTTTITLASLVNGHRVKFIPISYHHRVGNSKIKPVRDTLNFTQLIMRTVLYFDPMKVFIPASGLLVLCGFLVGGTTLVLQNVFGIGKFLDVTTVLLILTGLQFLAIGALADLITKRLR